jgi:hypothetical protein
MRKTIYFPEFATKLGFANTAFQYLFLSYIKRNYPLDLVLGKLNAGMLPDAAVLPVELFGISNYGAVIQPDCVAELSTNRLDGLLNDLANIAGFVVHESLHTLELKGYFQYHTATMAASGLRDEFAELFSPMGGSKFQNLLRSNQEILKNIFNEKTLVVCHIRQGDYKFYESHGIDFTYTTDIQALTQLIRSFVDQNYIRNAQIYLASDQPRECRLIFEQNGLNVLTYEDFFPELDVRSGSVLLLDMACMSLAQVLYASNSSFSVFGALLNTLSEKTSREALFFRPSPIDKQMIGFLPWNTQVLLTRADKYPATL